MKKFQLTFNLLTLAIFFISMSSCGDGQMAKPSDYKMITIESIPFIKNPWEGKVGFYEGDIIGIEIKLASDAGKKWGLYHNLMHYDFNYYAENCIGNENKESGIGIYSSEDLSKYANKKCLIIGKVEDLNILSPQDACDGAAVEIKFGKVYIEEIQ